MTDQDLKQASWLEQDPKSLRKYDDRGPLAQRMNRISEVGSEHVGRCVKNGQYSTVWQMSFDYQESVESQMLTLLKSFCSLFPCGSNGLESTTMEISRTWSHNRVESTAEHWFPASKWATIFNVAIPDHSTLQGASYL